MYNTREQVLINLLARQLGVITVQQAREHGMSDDAIRNRVRQGRWIRVSRGVYRLAGSPYTWEQRALAACLSIGPRAALSHGAAGAVFGLVDMQQGSIEVVVARGRYPSLPGKDVIVHRPRQLAPVDLCRVGPLHVTTPARTVIDEAAYLSPYGVQRLVDDALCRRLVSRDSLFRRAAVLSGRGRPGSTKLRHALDAWVPGRPADSAAEMDLIRRLASHGIPMPVRQHAIVCPGYGIARVDLAWPQAKLALELDSETWHDTPRAFHEDKARAVGIAAAGWEVLAVTPRNLQGRPARDLVEAIRLRLAVACAWP